MHGISSTSARTVRAQSTLRASSRRLLSPKSTPQAATGLASSGGGGTTWLAWAQATALVRCLAQGVSRT